MNSFPTKILTFYTSEEYLSSPFCHLFQKARNYINSLPHMPKRNFADVFIGANPLGIRNPYFLLGFNMNWTLLAGLKANWEMNHSDVRAFSQLLTCWRRCWFWTRINASPLQRHWPTHTSRSTTTRTTSPRPSRTTRASRAESWTSKSGKVSRWSNKV